MNSCENTDNTTSDTIFGGTTVSRKNITSDKKTISLKKDVLYEYNMLNSTIDYLNVIKKSKVLSIQIKKGINNALIESFLTHFRCLYDFLQLPRYDKKGNDISFRNKKTDDIVSSEYINNWKDIRPNCSDLLKNCRKRTDKELAHITSERPQGSAKNWPIIKMRDEIHEHIEFFFQNIG